MQSLRDNVRCPGHAQGGELANQIVGGGAGKVTANIRSGGTYPPPEAARRAASGQKFCRCLARQLRGEVYRYKQRSKDVFLESRYSMASRLLQMNFARVTRKPDGGSSGRAVRPVIGELNEINKKVTSVVNCICL